MNVNLKIKSGIIDCTNSLGQAMQEAGGAISPRILNMTVRDFIAEVAGQNNIRFVFSRPESRKELVENEISACKEKLCYLENMKTIT